jgi:hypothetical protein
MDDLDYVQMMVSLGACDDLSMDDSWKYANAGVFGPQISTVWKEERQYYRFLSKDPNP